MAGSLSLSRDSGREAELLMDTAAGRWIDTGEGDGRHSFLVASVFSVNEEAKKLAECKFKGGSVGDLREEKGQSNNLGEWENRQGIVVRLLGH